MPCGCADFHSAPEDAPYLLPQHCHLYHSSLEGNTTPWALADLCPAGTGQATAGTE